jgi:putative ABC transport system substrate-binding protein
MRRREFITIFGGAIAAWPFAARAQQAGKLPTIGFLGADSPSAWSNYVTAFEQRLHELGWIDGRTVAIAYRWAVEQSERYPVLAAEFSRLKVDVIVTAGNAVLATTHVTSVIPIVFAAATDPLSAGSVAAQSQLGGNVTGFLLPAADIAGKRLGLLREVLPGLHRVAIMANASDSSAMLRLGVVEATARRLGLETERLEIRKAEDIARAFETFKGGIDALYICTDALVSANRVRISSLALVARLPTIADVRTHVEAGALLSYGPNIPDLFRRAAEDVDKILHGTKPADIPIEQPTKFDLIVNRKTAKALGLEIPPTLLARADEVIE